MKKIFILPEGTWAHKEAQKYDAGYAVFGAYNQRAIFKALQSAIFNFEDLKKKNMDAGRLFAAENNMQNYIDVFEAVLKDNGIHLVGLNKASI